MTSRPTSNLPRRAEQVLDRCAGISREPLYTRIECLEQIIRAFRDIADRDDIHQAADRLTLVQAWIQSEAERAAADPIFFDLRLV